MRSSAALVIEDTNKRARLRQALEGTDHFQSVYIYHELSEVLTILKTDPPFDFLFLSHEVDQARHADFIAKVKAGPGGRQITFVSVVSPEYQSTETLTSQLLIGFHSVLCEPFSIASIEEILKVGNSMRAQQSFIRLKVAAHLIVASASGALDAGKAKSKSGPYNVLDRVKTSCEEFCKTTGSSTGTFIGKLTQSLHKQKPTERVGYSGPSERIRKKLLKQQADSTLNQRNDKK